MRFERPDCAFGGIAAVHVGWDKLVGAVPLVGNVTPVVRAGFVVEYNSVNWKLSTLKACHDGIGSSEAVSVVLGCERLNEDGVRHSVVGNHDVLIAALRPDGEASCVVGVESTER